MTPILSQWNMWPFGLVLSILLTPLSPSRAEEAREEIENGPPRPSPQQENRCRLLSHSSLKRDFLKAIGGDFEVQYTGEFLGNLSGGIRRGAVYEGLLESSLKLDLERFLSWQGGSFYARSLWTHGASPSAKYVGDLQTVSNIDAYDSIRLTELWLQQSWARNVFTFKAGQLMVDSDFITSNYSGLFLNSSFGWPTVPGANLNSPVYPVAAPGLFFQFRPASPITWSTGIYDGSPGAASLNKDGLDWNLHSQDGYYIVSEAAAEWKQISINRKLPGCVRFGIWHHTGDFDDLRDDTTRLSLADPSSNGQPRVHEGNTGFYGVLDQTLWVESSSTDQNPQEMNLFVKSGCAPGDQNLIELHVSGGIQCTGLFPSWDGVIMGIAISHALFGNAIRLFDLDENAFNGTTHAHRESETAIEFTCLIPISPYASLQPDLQWILNPQGTPVIGDAVLAGIRFQLQF